MFGPLIIDEGPSLSTTAGSAVAQLMLHWFSHMLIFWGEEMITFRPGKPSRSKADEFLQLLQGKGVIDLALDDRCQKHCIAGLLLFLWYKFHVATVKIN